MKMWCLLVRLSGFTVGRNKFSIHNTLSGYRVRIVFAYLHIGRTLKSDTSHQNYVNTASYMYPRSQIYKPELSHSVPPTI